MWKSNRPCALVVRLKYKGVRRDFAVPFRSNIFPKTPKNQYFALPPRPTTKPGHYHGIQYSKMFPVEKRHLVKFRMDGDPYYAMIQARIDANEKAIVSACQAYLADYEKTGGPKFSTDIDVIVALLESGTI